MTALVSFDLEDGGSVVVEMDETEPGFELVSRDGPVAAARRRFEEALSGVRGAAEAALRAFRDGALRPDEIEIEFGVRLNAETGAVIAKTAVEGHLTVKLTWQREANG